MQAEVELSGEKVIAKTFALHKKSSISLRIEPVNNRKQRLEKLRDWIHVNRPSIHQAMYADFQKHSAEVDGIELFHVLAEIKSALQNLDVWTSPKKIDAPMTMLGTKSFIQCEPRGVCLIISPWNYPFSLCIGPLVSALAAGNAVMVKPSELTPHVSSIIKQMTEEVFEPTIVSTHEGGATISEQLLKLPFDHIFFTGSPSIGKIVMKAAAENLSSVTLELGGKSPVIVTDSASLKDAAQRIAVAKFVNNGQTCVAPDYVLVDEKIADRFTTLLTEQVKKSFTEKGESFKESAHYCRIVNDKHFDRLNSVLQDAVDHGATPVFAGEIDRKNRFFHPVILTHISSAARIMNEEIFGPILPIVTYTKIEEAIRVVNDKPKPLALYLFSQSKKVQQKILSETSAGGVCINDCAIHFLHSNLPFGGVNHSGMGKSHGQYGFLAFSNEKPILKQRHGFTSVKAFYPPYTARTKRLINWFLKLY